MLVTLLLLTVASVTVAAASLTIPADIGVAVGSGAGIFTLGIYALRERRALRRIGGTVGSVASEQRRQAASMAALPAQAAAHASAVNEIRAELERQGSLLSGLADELQARMEKALETVPTQAELRRLHDAALRAGHCRFRQVEALLALHALFNVRGPLPPSRGWAASPDLLLYLGSLILERRPRVVLELGSGVSTVWLAYAMEQAGGHGRIVSLDHDARFADTTRKLVASHGLSAVVDVRHAPLVDVELDGTTWQWYDLATLSDVEGCDLAFVDGPPGAVGPRARHPALPLLEGRFSQAGVLVLDDCIRRDEKETIAQWRKRHPSWTVTMIDHEKGTAVFARTDHALRSLGEEPVEHRGNSSPGSAIP